MLLPPKSFTYSNSLNPPNKPLKYYHYMHFTDGEIESQRGDMIFPRLHSKWLSPPPPPPPAVKEEVAET